MRTGSLENRSERNKDMKIKCQGDREMSREWRLPVMSDHVETDTFLVPIHYVPSRMSQNIERVNRRKAPSARLGKTKRTKLIARSFETRLNYLIKINGAKHA